MNPSDVLSRSADSPSQVVRYGDHPDAVIDVFMPPNRRLDALPLVVLLHGGFWRTEYDRTHLRPLAGAVAADGFAVATPEYRRGPGSWPDMARDVEAALVGVRRLVGKAMRGRIEPDAPYVLAGHSAGGQLALWAGQRLGPDLVELVVGLAPVTDLRYAASTGMGDGAAQELLGGEPGEVPDRYADADPLPALGGRVPVTLIQGDADRQVPVAMNSRLASDFHPTEVGAPFRYVELPDVDHFDLIDPLSAAWPTLRRALTTRPEARWRR